MSVLQAIGRFFALIGRFLARVGRVLISLVRDDAYTEVRGTYPELTKPTGEQSATQASVTMNLTGLGNG